ncbi:MAG: hypothetical protein ACRDL5_12310 [Solirubrobacteraceae bacterium]
MEAGSLVAELATRRGARSAAADGEAAARLQLRGQIERLERELAAAFTAAYEIGAACTAPLAGQRRAAGAHARMLGLGELEVVRDDLVVRLRAVRIAIARRVDEQRRARALLARMLRDPGANRFRRVTCRQLGEPGCGAWEVRPRLGPVGMLMGWWQVKLSSGCPLCPHP